MVVRRTAPSRVGPLGSALAALLACFVFARIVQGLHRASFFIDLRPMYCAGVAVIAHASPYATQPLHACELAHGLETSSGVMPAPLPGYVLAPFVALAHLPYTLAILAYAVAGLAAFVAAAWLTARLAGLSWLAVLVGLFWTVGYYQLTLGKLSIFAIFAVVAAAFAASQGAWRWAALAACLALVQPQLGLPVVLALGLWFPPARAAVALGLAVLLTLSLLALGPAVTLDYLTRELPQHARAELYYPYQASLSWVLGQAHVTAPLALRLGSLSYVVMLAFGLAISYRFVRRGETALALLVPPAFVALGGSFIHGQQIETALPLAFVLTARARRGALVPALALMLLATASWTKIQYPFELVFVGYATYAALEHAFITRPRTVSALAGLAVVTVALEFAAWHLPHAHDVALSAADRRAVLQAGPLASDQWREYIDRSYRGRTVGSGDYLSKVLTWGSLVAIIAFATAAALDDGLLEPVAPGVPTAPWDLAFAPRRRLDAQPEA